MHKLTGDNSPYQHIRPTDWQPGGRFCSHVLMSTVGAMGMGHSLELFGMGEMRPFEELEPGAFVQYWWPKKKPGHSTTFLGYLDSHGNVMSSYSDAVAGFRFFSAQGKGAGSGLDFGSAFFEGR